MSHRRILNCCGSCCRSERYRIAFVVQSALPEHAVLSDPIDACRVVGTMRGLSLKTQVDQQLAKSPNTRNSRKRRALLQAALHATFARFCTMRTITSSTGTPGQVPCFRYT